MILTINLGDKVGAFDLIRLPVDTKKWPHLNSIALVMAIRTRRTILRWHRDQVGDDRCVMDDHLVHLTIDDTPLQFPGFNSVEGMSQCRQFSANRQAPDDVPQESPTEEERRSWDNDLRTIMGQKQAGDDVLRGELMPILVRTHLAIFAYRCTKPNTTFKDDRQLWGQALPENRRAYTRLPERFLDVRPDVREGCPQFWASHEACPAGVAHDVHRWGPCGGQAPTVTIKHG